MAALIMGMTHAEAKRIQRARLAAEGLRAVTVWVPPSGVDGIRALAASQVAAFRENLQQQRLRPQRPG
ncbi:MAG: antitoxin MazE-like protein, partial [Caldilineaceae bacterium]